MTLKLIGEPGHYRPGADTNHFLGLCDECDARYLAGMTLAQVESWGPNGERGKAGAVRQAMFEAYMHVWATGAPRFSNLGAGWTEEPTDPEVIALVAEIRKAAEERKGQDR
ncbi:MAG TPA: hypothetical protein VFU47_14965 [Armatimonadota bacterium]|nr:hypothetical protein [Armatimonadota bacterium]